MPPHELKTHAIRTVIASCLYGADINAMAVEMCKLSLWLVSLDPKLPFSFVDDKILHGNSLLGLTDVAPAQAPAHRPRRGRQRSRAAVRAGRGRRAQAGHAAPPRSSPPRSTTTTRSARPPPSGGSGSEYQDAHRAACARSPTAVIAAGLRLGGKPGRALNVAYENLSIAIDEAYPTTARAGPDDARRRSSRRGSPPRSPPTTTGGSRCTGSSPSPT